MRAVSSVSTIKPVDTTLRSPGPSGRSSGTIFPRSSSEFAGRAFSRESTPSILGTLNPQISASRTPTVRPREAKAVAMLTVTEDVPTPPFPEAIEMTRVRAGIWLGAAVSRALSRARSMTRVRSSGVNSSQCNWTELMPGSDSTRVSQSRFMDARSGHPAVVRAIVM